MMKKIEELEKQTALLSKRIKESEEKIDILAKNFFELGTAFKDNAIIQQQLLEHVGILSEVISNIQSSEKSITILKYDMPNEPYN